MKASLYATEGDYVEMVKNKRNVMEERNVEGPKVWESAPFELTPESFASMYRIAKTYSPNCIVRFAKDPK